MKINNFFGISHGQFQRQFWVQFRVQILGTISGQNVDYIFKKLGIFLWYFSIIAQPIGSFSKFQTNLPRFHRQDRLLKLHPDLALAFFDFCQWTWKKWKISFFIINFLPWSSVILHKRTKVRLQTFLNIYNFFNYQSQNSSSNWSVNDL